MKEIRIIQLGDTWTIKADDESLATKKRDDVLTAIVAWVQDRPINPRKTQKAKVYNAKL